MTQRYGQEEWNGDVGGGGGVVPPLTPSPKKTGKGFFSSLCSKEKRQRFALLRQDSRTATDRTEQTSSCSVPCEDSTDQPGRKSRHHRKVQPERKTEEPF